jgi:hypothetical protein
VNFLREAAAAGDTCFVPENIIYKFLRVATHPRVFPQPLHASEEFGTSYIQAPIFWLERRWLYGFSVFNTDTTGTRDAGMDSR